MKPADASSQSDFAAALFDPSSACPDGLRVWNGSDPTRRLAVYRNNVIVSLVDALAETFPVVQELVGTEFFRAMAAVFVRQAPPHSRILARYGQAFPGFIEQFEPARVVAYLADMARLEFARVRAYHAADAEPVTKEALGLAMANPERIPELRLVCHPSLSVVESSFAVVSIWAAHQGEGDLATIDPAQAQDAFVLRDGLEVLVLHAPPGGAAFVAGLLQGRCLGDAVTAAAACAPAFDVAAVLSLLAYHGALTSIHWPRSLAS
jgi:putative DNA-binding protein